MFTHEIVRYKDGTQVIGQKCLKAVWWPSKDVEIGKREKKWPLMYFEDGRVMRVNANNLRTI